MVRRRHQLISLRAFLVAGIVPLLLVSVGYALFSQNLSLQGKGTAVVDTVPPSGGLVATWVRNMWQSGSNWSYNMNGTVSNTGTTPSSTWEIIVQLPASVTGLSCWGADCTLQGTTLTIANLSYNGVIAPGGSTTLGVSFVSSSNAVTFNDAVIIANGTGAQFAEISGLTATMTLQNQWQSGSSYVKQYNVSVTNATGSNVKAWRIKVSNWVSTTHMVESIWNAGYVSEPSSLLLTGQAGLNSGASASFGVQLKVPSSGWSPTFIVEGRV